MQCRTCAYARGMIAIDIDYVKVLYGNELLVGIQKLCHHIFLKTFEGAENVIFISLIFSDFNLS